MLQHNDVYRFYLADGDILMRRDVGNGKKNYVAILTGHEIVNSFEINELIKKGNAHDELMQIITDWLMADNSDSNIAREKVKSRMRAAKEKFKSEEQQ